MNSETTKQNRDYIIEISSNAVLSLKKEKQCQFQMTGLRMTLKQLASEAILKQYGPPQSPPAPSPAEQIMANRLLQDSDGNRLSALRSIPSDLPPEFGQKVAQIIASGNE